jgi:hypothetical protein
MVLDLVKQIFLKAKSSWISNVSCKANPCCAINSPAFCYLSSPIFTTLFLSIKNTKKEKIEDIINRTRGENSWKKIVGKSCVLPPFPGEKVRMLPKSKWMMFTEREPVTASCRERMANLEFPVKDI